MRLDSAAICVRLVVFSPRCFPEGPAPSPLLPYRRYMDVGRVGRPSRETRHTSRISQQQRRQRSRAANAKNTECRMSSFLIHARLALPSLHRVYLLLLMSLSSLLLLLLLLLSSSLTIRTTHESVHGDTGCTHHTTR